MDQTNKDEQLQVVTRPSMSSIRPQCFMHDAYRTTDMHVIQAFWHSGVMLIHQRLSCVAYKPWMIISKWYPQAFSKGSCGMRLATSQPKASLAWASAASSANLKCLFKWVGKSQASMNHIGEAGCTAMLSRPPCSYSTHESVIRSSLRGVKRQCHVGCRLYLCQRWHVNVYHHVSWLAGLLTAWPRRKQQHMQ